MDGLQRRIAARGPIAGTHERAGPGRGTNLRGPMAELDLAQFHDTFFEESFEALDGMEAALLKLDVGAPNPEGVNTIFRVAHSIKGGADMLGCTDVASCCTLLGT